MKKIKRFYAILLSVVMLAVLISACGGNNGNSANAPANTEGNAQGEGSADGPKPLKIHYLTSKLLTDGAVQTIMDLAEQYKKINPGFELEVESISDRPAYLQKIKILASANELPDWFDADPEPFFEGIAKKDLVVNIGDVYDELGVTDKFFKVSIDYPRLDDGSLYLMTWNANAEYFWYNKDMFTKAGVTEPKTFDEFLAVAEKLKSQNITPISVHGKDFWPLLRYMAFIPFRMEGNDYLDKLRKGEAKMSDEPGIKTAEFLQTLGKNYFNEGWSNADYNTSLELFLSGKTAMYYIGTWQVKDMIDENMNLKENIGYFKMPTYSASDKTTPSDFFANSGIGTAITKDSYNDEMKNWLKFLFDNFADTALYKYHIIPSIQPEIKDDLSQIYKDMLKDISEVQTYTKVWDVRLDPETNEVIGRETTNLALGVSTPEQFAKRIDDAIAQNAPKYFK
ncbi:ABC transporter substrate-binding protein [Paenibacillus sp. sgz302251]|uniref:ABC transporter substrate-binding protein n=1 Tax=Paenibacillus sp. sgz302251 TaxID=3414493 RepID=UPI003C7A7E60